MSEEDPVPRFFSFLLAFMGAMLGVVLSGNLVQLVFFWELTSLFSFLLIGYWHQNPAAREGARMALTVTGTGGLCLFVGVLLIGRIVGSYDLDIVLASGDLIRSHSLYVPALVLILLGAFTKSAQFPFHFWLPHAMAAPTPVSAYLHSATMVKAGIFLLIRLWPVMAGTDVWFCTVVPVGLATLVFGASSAIFQQDMKGLLAYSTISHLGLITLLLGLGSPLARGGGDLPHHQPRDLQGLALHGRGHHRSRDRHARPAQARAGSIPHAGDRHGLPWSRRRRWRECRCSTASCPRRCSSPRRSRTIRGRCSTIAALFRDAGRHLQRRLFAALHPRRLFRPTAGRPAAHAARAGAMDALSDRGAGADLHRGGSHPGLTIGPVLATAAMAVIGPDLPPYSLALWHGFTLALAMSIVAVIGGVVLYLFLRSYLDSGIEGPPLLRRLKGQRIFDDVLVTVSWRWARALERWLGTRRLQPQLRILLAVTLAAGFLPFYLNGWPGVGSDAVDLDRPGLRPGLGDWRRLRARRRLQGEVPSPRGADPRRRRRPRHLHHLRLAIGAGPCGDAAPRRDRDHRADPARPALAAEAPGAGKSRGPDLKARLRRYLDLAFAMLVGAGLTAISYAVMTRPLPESVSRYFVERAYTEGGGTNIVNVILVDFRGFDTQGEIAVLCIVALTVFALLRRFRPATEATESPEQQRIQNALDDAAPDRQVGDTLSDYLFIPRIIMHWMFPVIGVLAVYLFMRGHDLPGGGFAAGITLSITFIVQYMASGTRWVEDRLRVLPLRWMGLGAPHLDRHRRRLVVLRLSVPDLGSALSRRAGHRQGSDGERPAVRSRRLRPGGRRDRADPRRPRPPVAAHAAPVPHPRQG